MSKSRCFGSCNTHEQRTYQAGTHGHTNQVDVLPGYLGLFHGLIHHPVDVFQVMTGCNFRHYAAILLKNINL